MRAAQVSGEHLSLYSSGVCGHQVGCGGNEDGTMDGWSHQAGHN